MPFEIFNTWDAETFNVVISFIAIILTLYIFMLKRKYERYVKSDESLFDILKVNLEYPHFNDPNFTNKLDTSENDYENMQRYDIYAMMIWNFIETMIDYSNRRKFNNSDFYGPIVYWTFLHLKWLSLERNDNYFTMNIPDHVEFIVDNDKGKHKTYIVCYLFSKNNSSVSNIEIITDDEWKNSIFFYSEKERRITLESKKLDKSQTAILCNRRKAKVIDLIKLWSISLKYGCGGIVVSPKMSSFSKVLIKMSNEKIIHEIYNLEVEDIIMSKSFWDQLYGITAITQPTHQNLPKTKNYR
jgi:hypothetical protein